MMTLSNTVFSTIFMVLMVNDSINQCHEYNDLIELRISHPKRSEMYFKENFARKPVRLYLPIPYIARINWNHLANIKEFRNCYFRILYYSQKLEQSTHGMDFHEIKYSKLLLSNQTEIDISIFPDHEYFFKLLSMKYGNVTSHDYIKIRIPSQSINKYFDGHIVWWLGQQYDSVSRMTSFQPCCLTYCKPLFKRKPLVTTVKVLEGAGYVPIIKTEVSWKLGYLQYPSCISHYDSSLYNTLNIGIASSLLKRLNRFDTKFSIDNEEVKCHRNFKYVILVHGWNNRTFDTEYWTPNICASKERPNLTVDETHSTTSRPFRWITPFSDLPKLWKLLWYAITKRTNI